MVDDQGFRNVCIEIISLGCQVLFLSFVVCRNEEPHVKKRMGKHGEKVDLILRVDLVKYFVNM